ncbi:MAG: hypothetical protein AAGG51_21990 [Cyanobacteria bacterium P01_G01_bin.54]
MVPQLAAFELRQCRSENPVKLAIEPVERLQISRQPKLEAQEAS